MNKLDPHTLFSLFEQGDEEVYKEHGAESALDNPYVILNMVTRGMDNYSMMDMLYKKNNPVSYKQVRNTIKFKYFTKLFNYLDRLNIDSIRDTKYVIGESYDLPNLIARLDNLRLYFEEYELYERCLVIKNTIDVLYEQSYRQLPKKKLLI